MDPSNALFGQSEDSFPKAYQACQSQPPPRGTTADARDRDAGSALDVAGTDECNKLAVVAHILATLNKGELAGSEGDRIVIVSNFTRTLDLVAGLCRRMGYGFLRLDGATPTVQRHELVSRFNRRLAADFVFLLSSKVKRPAVSSPSISRLSGRVE